MNESGRASLPSESERIEAVLAGDREVWTPPPVRQASTVALLRDAPDGLNTYLVQRAPTMNFPAVTAYPGGAHEPEDGAPGEPLTAVRAAIRELHEETAVSLESESSLVPFARWVTPEILPVRFDTYFFAVALPGGQEPTLVGTEAVAARWWSPGQVLRDRRSLGLKLLPPTLATLAQLAQFNDVTGALNGIRPDRIPTLLPRPVRAGDRVAWEVVDTDTGSVIATGDKLAEL